MLFVNLADARDMLKRAVEDTGRDTLYKDRFNELVTGRLDISYDDSPTCLYSTTVDADVVPLCVVGVVLTKDGPEGLDILLSLADYEGGVTEVLSTCEDSLTMTLAAAVYLTIAQTQQDKEFSWGEALDTSENAVADHALDFLDDVSVFEPSSTSLSPNVIAGQIIRRNDEDY